MIRGKFISLVWIVAAFGIALYTTITGTIPALNFIVSDAGERYSHALVFLLTLFLLLLPLAVIRIVMAYVIVRSSRQKLQELTSSNRGIILYRANAMPMYLDALDVYINDQKAGKIVSGESRFFPVTADAALVEIRTWRYGSVPAEILVPATGQARLEVRVDEAAMKKAGFRKVPDAFYFIVLP